MIKNFFKKLFKHRHTWEAVPCFFPYRGPYGVKCFGCGTILDTDISKKKAKWIANMQSTEVE